jgi:hypothetical protein
LGEDLDQCRACSSAEAWAAMDRRWRVKSVTGQWLALVPGGDSQAVLWSEREEWMQQLVRVRLRECEKQVCLRHARMWNIAGQGRTAIRKARGGKQNKGKMPLALWDRTWWDRTRCGWEQADAGLWGRR